jgi:hypothetical protein
MTRRRRKINKLHARGTYKSRQQWRHDKLAKAVLDSMETFADSLGIEIQQFREMMETNS